MGRFSVFQGDRNFSADLRPVAAACCLRVRKNFCSSCAGVSFPFVIIGGAASGEGANRVDLAHGVVDVQVDPVGSRSPHDHAGVLLGKTRGGRSHLLYLAPLGGVEEEDDIVTAGEKQVYEGILLGIVGTLLSVDPVQVHSLLAIEIVVLQGLCEGLRHSVVEEGVFARRVVDIDDGHVLTHEVEARGCRLTHVKREIEDLGRAACKCQGRNKSEYRVKFSSHMLTKNNVHYRVGTSIPEVPSERGRFQSTLHKGRTCPRLSPPPG